VRGRRQDLRHFADVVRQRDAAALVLQLSDSVRWRAERRLSHHGERDFVDRSQGREELLLVLAGYKPYLWPYTLARLERFVPAHVDVCIVSPGVAPPELAELAARNGWSSLRTRRNSLCLAQNLAIAAHPQARYIHKLDEDVVIGAGHLERLRAGYDAVAAEGRFRPGFAAPVLNVNGFSYRPFLEELDLLGEYRERFGEPLQASVLGAPVQTSGEVARWLWEQSIPFDAVAARFAARPFGYTAIPHRFSIGSFVMERDLWEAFGGFAAHPLGDLGRDELQLCRECAERSRVPVMLHDVFAGHWSFGPQEPAMRAALPGFADGLRPPLDAPAAR
jgi:hypothetical protein